MFTDKMSCMYLNPIGTGVFSEPVKSEEMGVFPLFVNLGC